MFGSLAAGTKVTCTAVIASTVFIAPTAIACIACGFGTAALFFYGLVSGVINGKRSNDGGVNEVAAGMRNMNYFHVKPTQDSITYVGYFNVQDGLQAQVSYIVNSTHHPPAYRITHQAPLAKRQTESSSNGAMNIWVWAENIVASRGEAMSATWDDIIVLGASIAVAGDADSGTKAYTSACFDMGGYGSPADIGYTIITDVPYVSVPTNGGYYSKCLE